MLVVIPAFGVNDYIEQAIESVLAQTYRDYMPVVVNDGAPSEETAELRVILAWYADRVAYLERENGGPAAARNTAMRLYATRYVAFLDGDDYWAPTFLEQQVARLEADPGLALVYSDAHIVGRGVPPGSTYMQTNPSSGDVTLEALLGGRCNIALSTVVARRDGIVGAGWIDERLLHSEDFDLWLRMARCGMRMGYCREALVHRRVRPDSLSAADVKLNHAALGVLERFERNHALGPEERVAAATFKARLCSEIALSEAKRALDRGEYRTSAAFFGLLEPRFVNWKVQAVRLGLQTAPQLMRLSYMLLRRAQQLQQRRREARRQRAARPSIAVRAHPYRADLDALRCRRAARAVPV